MFLKSSPPGLAEKANLDGRFPNCLCITRLFIVDFLPSTHTISINLEYRLLTEQSILVKLMKKIAWSGKIEGFVKH